MKPTAARLPASLSLALLAAVSGPSASPAGLPPAPQDAGSAAAERPEAAVALEAPEADRLLVLADGRVLRARSRRAAGAWEVRSGREWKALPSGWVASARLERDVLKEARERERALGRRPAAAARAEHAGWLLAQGLQAEGLRALDGVLADEPDQADALAVLAGFAEGGARLPLPALRGSEDEAAALDAFLRGAARLPAAGRELAALQLAREAERGPLEERLRAELTAGTNQRRAFAGLALRRLFPGRALEPLLRRAVLDGSEAVRLEASLALGAAANPAVVVPVARALASGSSAVRANAAEALGNMGYAAGVPALMTSLLAAEGYRPPAAHVFVGHQQAYIQDFDVEIANAESIADPEINVLQEGAVLDVRVLATTQISAPAAAARRALGRLTGADPGGTKAAWKRWWWENETEWLARAAAEAQPATTGGGERTGG